MPPKLGRLSYVTALDRHQSAPPLLHSMQHKGGSVETTNTSTASLTVLCQDHNPYGGLMAVREVAVIRDSLAVALL